MRTFKLFLGFLAVLACGVALLVPAPISARPRSKPPTGRRSSCSACSLPARCTSPSGLPAKTKSAADFYTAGGGITGFQNGLAIAGD